MRGRTQFDVLVLSPVSAPGVPGTRQQKDYEHHYATVGMLSNPAELLDLLVTLGYAVLGAGLVGGGLLAELRSVASLGGGEFVFGIWLAGLGMIAIAAGTMVFTDKVKSRIGAA
jgi:hypothetical protein